MKINNLEELSNHLIDNWTTGNYTGGYDNKECLLSGKQMSEVFIQEARKMFPGEEQAEIMWHSEQLEEYVEEGIAHLNTKFA